MPHVLQHGLRPGEVSELGRLEMTAEIGGGIVHGANPHPKVFNR